MKSTLEHIWLKRHGALQRFARDSEFHTGPMRRFLILQNIQICELPARSHKKTGVVDKNPLTIIRIIEKLQLATETDTHTTIL